MNVDTITPNHPGYAIFSIDDWYNPYTLGKFCSYMDVQRASGKTKNKMKMIIGGYEGKLELSFVVHMDDFEKFVKPTFFIEKQRSWLKVSADQKEVYEVFFGHGEGEVFIGTIRDIGSKGVKFPNFSYRPDLHTFFEASYD